MPDTKQYLMGVRSSATVPAAVRNQLDGLPARLPSLTCVRTLATGQRLFRMAGETAAALTRECPGLAIEEDQPLELCAPEPRAPATASPFRWAQLAVRAERVSSRFTGKTVRVAVVASGAVPHPALRIAGGRNFLAAADPDAWREDESSSGTHCCGILSSPPGPGRAPGIAPAAEIFALKVLPGGTLAALVEAIDWCIENYIDVIAVCAGVRAPSLHLMTIFEDARAHGIVAVAAAGDTAGDVLYPAACPRVIGVSAIARTLAGYAAAPFSNSGPGVDLCAPGAGIAAAVPGGFAARDGTAAACAFVAGVAALVLEAYSDLRTADSSQADRVRGILLESAVSVGLPPAARGRGLLNAALALRGASMPRAGEKAPAWNQQHADAPRRPPQTLQLP
jgi:subtilisin family serine protease